MGEFGGGVAELGLQRGALGGMGGLEKGADGSDFGSGDEVVSGDLHGEFRQDEGIRIRIDGTFLVFRDPGKARRCLGKR
jgi:hypothetical protein